jgi:hypothetical protein
MPETGFATDSRGKTILRIPGHAWSEMGLSGSSVVNANGSQRASASLASGLKAAGYEPVGVATANDAASAVAAES